MTMTPHAQFLRSVSDALREYIAAVNQKGKKPKPATKRLEGFDQDADYVHLTLENSPSWWTVDQLADALAWNADRIRKALTALRYQGRVVYRQGRARRQTQAPSRPAPKRQAQVDAVLAVLADGRTMASKDLYQAAGIPQGSWPLVRDYMVRRGMIVAADISNGKGFNFCLAPSERPASINPEHERTES